MKLVIVNGQPLTGKDTFVDACLDACEARNLTADKISSVDRVKEAAVLLGWDEEKDPKGRAFLSNLKDMSTLNYEGPMRYMEDMIVEGIEQGHSAMFFFIREPAEIAKFKEANPGTISLLVRRGDHDTNQSNHADLNVLKHEYDVVIDNYGDLYDLGEKACNFMHELVPA